MHDPTPESQKDLPRITLAEAKTFLREVDADLFSRVPIDQIVEDTRRPEEKNTVLGCSGDMEDPYKDGVFLTGGGVMYLSGSSDLRPMMDEIFEDYGSKEEWKTSWASQPGRLELEIVSPEGYEFYVGAPTTPNKKNLLRFSVNGFGPCIPTPPGFNAATDFEY